MATIYAIAGRRHQAAQTQREYRPGAVLMGLYLLVILGTVLALIEGHVIGVGIFYTICLGTVAAMMKYSVATEPPASASSDYN